ATSAAVDPRLDADTHRAATVQAYEELASPSAMDPRLDSDSHRAPTGPQASDASAAPHYVNGGLDPAEQLAIYSQVNGDSTTDARQDADHHREAAGH
ncbi:MAG: hypothetical protein ACJ739_03810, partial [Acidimicrobiales bacterium]